MQVKIKLFFKKGDSMNKAILNILALILVIVAIWSDYYLEDFKMISTFCTGLIGIIALVKEDLIRKEKNK